MSVARIKRVGAHPEAFNRWCKLNFQMTGEQFLTHYGHTLETGKNLFFCETKYANAAEIADTAIAKLSDAILVPIRRDVYLGSAKVRVKLPGVVPRDYTPDIVYMWTQSWVHLEGRCARESYPTLYLSSRIPKTPTQVEPISTEEEAAYQFECVECEEFFKTEEELEAHTRDTHGV